MVTVKEALQRVASGKISNKDPIDVPVHELIAKVLFEVANTPDQRVRGSMRRATRAQKIIMDRLVGKRLPGTSPAAQREQEINFVDLTAGLLGNEDEDDG